MTQLLGPDPEDCVLLLVTVCGGIAQAAQWQRRLLWCKRLQIQAGPYVFLPAQTFPIAQCAIVLPQTNF